MQKEYNDIRFKQKIIYDLILYIEVFFNNYIADFIIFLQSSLRLQVKVFEIRKGCG